MKLLLVVLLTCAAAAAQLPSAPSARAANGTSVLVRTAKPVRKPMTTEFTGYGTVTTDTGAVINISVPRAGRVMKLDVVAGERVQRGVPLLDFATDPAAAASYRQAQTAVHTARGELERMTHLVAQQLATRSQLATARKALADAQAVLAAQRALGNDKHRTAVTAPFAGVVQAVNVKAGDLVSARSAVVQMIRAGALRVVMGVEPKRATRVKPGMPVHVMPVFGGDDLTGQVGAVQGMLDPKTRLVNVVVRLDCGTHCDGLLPGTPVKGVIDVARQTLWTIPRSAVLKDARGAYVFQVADGHARRVNVRIAARTAHEIGIRGHLDPQFKVVVLGDYELTNGMAVREMH